MQLNTRIVFALGGNSSLFAATCAPTGSPIFSPSDLEVKHGSAQPLCPKYAMAYLNPCEILVMVGRPMKSAPVSRANSLNQRVGDLAHARRYDKEVTSRFDVWLHVPCTGLFKASWRYNSELWTRKSVSVVRSGLCLL